MSYQPKQGQRPGYYAAIKKSQGQQQQQKFGGSGSSAAAAAPARGPGAKRIIWFSVKEVVWPPEFTTVFYDIRSQKMREAAGDRALHGHEFKPCLPEEDGFLHQRHRHDLHTVRNEATGKEVIAEGGDDEDEDETDESDSTAADDDQQMSKDDDDETGDTDSQRTQRVNFDRSQLEESILNGTSEIVAKVQQYTHDEEKGHNHFEIIEKSEKFVMMQGIPSIDPYFIYQAEVQDTTKKHPHRDINMLQLLDMRMQPLTYAKGHISNFKHMLHVELQLSPSFTQQLAQQVEKLAIIKEEERRVQLQQQRDREEREEREEAERKRKEQEEARTAAAAKAAASKAAAQQQQQQKQQQKQSGNIFAKGGRGAQQPPAQQQSRITFFAEKKQKPATIVNERLIRDEYIKEALPSEIYKELRNRTYYYMYQELQNVLQECTGGCIRVNNKRFFLQANMHAIEELRRKLRWEPWMIIVPDVRQSFHLQSLSYADYDDLRRHYQTLRLSDLPEMARNEGLDKMRYPRAWPQNMLYVMLLYHLLEKPAKSATGDMFTTMETLVAALREHITKGRGNKQRQEEIRRFQSADINQPGADLAAYCGNPWVWSFDKFRMQHGHLYRHLVQALCWVTKRRRDIVLVRDISDSPLAEKLVREGSLSFYLGYDGDDGSDGGDFISQDDEDEEDGSSSSKERTLTPNECSSTMRIYRSSVWKKQTRIVTFLRSHAKEMLAKMPKYSAHKVYAEHAYKTLTRMRTGTEPTMPLYTDSEWRNFESLFPDEDIIQMTLAGRMAEQQDVDVEDIMQREEGSNLFRHEAVQVYIKPHEHMDWKSMLMERLGGISLNTEQSVAMDMLLDPSKGVCVINGPPGSGKTLLIQALFIAMDRPFGNGLFLTLGGRLSQQHNERMRTLHKYMNETEASKGPVVRDMNLMALTIHMARAIFRAGGKVFNRFVAMVKSLNVLVLDEAQNEDIDLVCMIIHLALQSPVLQKIVFVGDPNQIPPYGIGNPFWGIIEWAKQKGVDSYFKLEENNRVSNISKDDPRMQLVEDTRILVNETVSTHIDNTLKGFPFTADQMRELRENPHAGSNMVIKKMRYKAIHSDELTPEEKQQQELQQWENNILPSQRISRAPPTLDLRTAYEPPRDSVVFVTRSDFEKMCSYILRVYKMHKSIYKDINILTGNKDTIFRINRWLGHKLRDEVAFQSGDRYNRGTATQQYVPYLHEKSYITVGTKICMRKNIRRAIVPIRKVLLDKFNMYRKQRRQDREKKQQSKHGGEEEESAEEEEPQRNSPFQSDVFARLQAALQWGEAQGNENDNGNRQTVQEIMSKHFCAEEDVDYIITAAVTNGELDWIQEIRHDVGDPELNLQVVKLLQSQKTIVVGPQHVPERHIVPGYVTTVDSQMGSECKICVLVLDGRRNISWLDRARVVVGFTRAIEKLYVLAEEWNVPAWQLQSKLKSREDLGGRPRYNVDKITKLTDAEVNQLNNRMWRDRDDAKKHNNLQSFLEERYDSVLRNGEDFRDEIITLNAIMIFQLLYTNPTRQRLSDLARHLRDGIEEPPPAASLLAARNAARQAAEQREEQDELMRQAVTPTSSDEELIPSKSTVAAAVVMEEEEEENVMQDDEEEQQQPPSHESTSLFSRIMRRGKKRSRPSIEEEEEKSHRSQPSSSGDDSSESSDEENDNNQPPAKKQHTAPLLMDEEEE